MYRLGTVSSGKLTARWLEYPHVQLTQPMDPEKKKFELYYFPY